MNPCSIFLKDRSKETPKTGRGRKGTAERLFCLIFAPKSIFSAQIPKLQHLSSRLQRGRNMLFPPAHNCYPRGAGCSPKTSHNRNTKMNFCCPLLGLAALFLSLRSLFSRKTKFLDSERIGYRVTGVFFLLPSIYGILCFFPSVLAAYMSHAWGQGKDRISH